MPINKANLQVSVRPPAHMTCPDQQPSSTSKELHHNLVILLQIAVLHQHKKRASSSGFYQEINAVCRQESRPYRKWLVFWLRSALEMPPSSLSAKNGPTTTLSVMMTCNLNSITSIIINRLNAKILCLFRASLNIFKI